jgi:uncharacterized cupredoxin-like copper-binding protein
MVIFDLIRAVAALAALASPASAEFASAPTVTIALSSFQIAPATIKLAAGRPVILHITNRSGQRHDLTAPAFFAASRIRPSDARLASGGSVQLAREQEVVIALIPQAGTYQVKCARPLHKAFGMSGTIVVSQ